MPPVARIRFASAPGCGQMHGMSEFKDEESLKRDDGAADPAPEETPRSFSVDVSRGLEEGLRTATERARVLLKKGKHTRVRLSFRGRELATMPLSVFVAAEAASLFLAGPARLLGVLAANAVGKVLLDVEFINEAGAVVATGKDRLLDGELEEALACFREAIEMDGAFAPAWLNVGIALKLRGDRDDARAAFEKALNLDADGDIGKEARRQLEALKSRAV